MFFLNFLEEAVNVGLGSHVGLMGGKALGGGGLLEVGYEVFDGGFVRGVCEGKVTAMREELAGARSSKPRKDVLVRSSLMEA